MSKKRACTIRDLLKIKHGFAFLGEHFSDEGESIILTPGNFYERGGFKRIAGKEKYYLADFPTEYICEKDDLVIAMTQQAEGLLGSTALIPESGIYLHNQRIGLIEPKTSEADKLFLYYLFMTKSVRKQIRATATGSKVKHTSPESIYDVKVWIPKELKEQLNIAETLYAIDCKIEVNNAINAELERLAKAIYEYWFVQFDFPNAEGKPYKSSGGAMTYSPTFKREIPTGWNVVPLTKSKLCKLISTGADRFNGEKIYLATSDVDKAEIVSHATLTDFANRLSRANMQPRLNSVWFAKMKNTVKNILVDSGATELIESYIFSTGFSGMQCQEQTLYYLWNYLRGDYFEARKNMIATGATQQAINEDDLDNFLIVEPPKDLLLGFNGAVKASYIQIGKNKRQNLELAKLRDFLLPLLMNGQVTIEDKGGAA